MMSPTQRPSHTAPVCPEIPSTPAEDEYPPSLLAFGPADHEFESEGSDDADAYIVGYN